MTIDELKNKIAALEARFNAAAEGLDVVPGSAYVEWADLQLELAHRTGQDQGGE